MQRYIPNSVPARVRVLLALMSVGLLVYMVAGLATGYTYVPARRGGILLSGLPTLLIVLAASALFLAALLTIVDHYDQRPNEITYATVRRICLRLAFYLFIAAPFVEFTNMILLDRGIHLLPEVHGFAEHSTFHSPRLRAFAQYVDPVLGNTLVIVLIALATAGMARVLNKHSNARKRAAAVLGGISALALSVLVLANSTHDFLTGEVHAGRRSNRYVVQAEVEPAKFNAILLTEFMMGGAIFSGGLFMLFVVARRPDSGSTLDQIRKNLSSDY